MRGILWGALFVSMVKDLFTVICAIFSLIFQLIGWICDKLLEQ